MIAILLGGFKWLGKIIMILLQCAKKHPLLAVVAGLVAGIAFLVLVTIPGLRHDIAVQSAAKDILAKQYVLEQRAHTETIAGYIQARIDAAALDKQNVERVEREFSNQLSEITNENDELHSANRGLIAQRMRSSETRTAAVSAGSGGETQLPIISELPRRPLRGSTAAIISKADAIICADNHSQLVGMISAWKAVSAIDVNSDGDEAD